MTFKELVENVAKNCDCTQAATTRVLREMIEQVAGALADGEEVQLTNFGTFSLREIKAREGRNPQTGEKIQIAASKTPAFKAYPGFKKRFK
ncbi:MAG: HU family DNA-binding protein [Eubacteriales bacterium]|nr:HU family DNA-binding protein [Eubacteriales bacterium]